MPLNCILPRGGMRRLVYDTFTGASGSLLNAHIPDQGATGWTSDAVWRIQFNSATYDFTTLTPSMAFAFLASNALDTRMWVLAQVHRGNDDPAIAPYQECGGIHFLRRPDTGEGCILFARSTGPATADIIFQRLSAGGIVVQEVVVHANYPLPVDTSLGELGAIVYGTAVYPTIKAGAVTTVYPSIAIPDLRDGLHRRVGLCALTGDPSGRYFMDRFTVFLLD